MVVLFFFGALAEELAWTLMLTQPLVETNGVLLGSVIIGIVWALWHVIPWRFNHSNSWVCGMSLFTILIRIVMVIVYLDSQNMWLIVILHMVVNICLTIFNKINVWLLSLALIPIIFLIL